MGHILENFSVNVHYSKMKENKEINLQKISFRFFQSHKLQWQKGKNEFIYQSEFYDVEGFEMKGGTIIWHCKHDPLQKVLVKKFNKIRKRITEEKKKKGGLLVFSFYQSPIRIHFSPLTANQMMNTDLNHLYSFHLLNLPYSPPDGI